MTTESIPVPDLGTPEPTTTLPPIVEPDAIYTPGEPRKRSRRRPQQPPPPPEPTPQTTEQEKQAIAKALAMGARVIFGIIASRRGEHWNLTTDEENMAGEVTMQALEPYLAASAKYMPIAVACLAITGLVVPRLQRDAEIAEQTQTPKIEVVP